jgi:hypothetical protein
MRAEGLVTLGCVRLAHLLKAGAHLEEGSTRTAVRRLQEEVVEERKMVHL